MEQEQQQMRNKQHYNMMVIAAKLVEYLLYKPDNIKKETAALFMPLSSPPPQLSPLPETTLMETTDERQIDFNL